MKRLFDTNIFVYSVSSHPSEREKSGKAPAVLAKADLGTSAQVLGEFYVTATQKIAEPLPEPAALQFINHLIRFPVAPVDAELVLRAIGLKREYQISFWDGAIIAAAYRLGATLIYSEDLAHGRLYGTARVIDPFKSG